MTDAFFSGDTGHPISIPNSGSGPNISNIQLTINSPSGLANWNPPQTAIVSHYDPTVGDIVSETFPIGSSYGPSVVSITTGSLSPGHYAGEIQVTVLDSSMFNGLGPGVKFIGTVGKLLKAYGYINNAVDGLATSASFTVDISGKKVIPIDLSLNYAPGSSAACALIMNTSGSPRIFFSSIAASWTDHHTGDRK